MAVKKPSLPLPSDRGFAAAAKECLERIMGRRGGRTEKVPAIALDTLTSAPTAADFNTLMAAHETLRARFNDLLDQLEDP